MSMHPAVLQALLPTDMFHLANITHTTSEVTVTLCASRSAVPCPVCGTVTGRIHTHYRRILADLPWSGLQVRLQLTVRTFRCPVPSCPRRVFTERLPRVAASSARRTTRLAE